MFEGSLSEPHVSHRYSQESAKCTSKYDSNSLTSPGRSSGARTRGLNGRGVESRGWVMWEPATVGAASASGGVSLSRRPMKIRGRNQSFLDRDRDAQRRNPVLTTSWRRAAVVCMCKMRLPFLTRLLRRPLAGSVSLFMPLSVSCDRVRLS